MKFAISSSIKCFGERRSCQSWASVQILREELTFSAVPMFTAPSGFLVGCHCRDRILSALSRMLGPDASSFPRALSVEFEADMLKRTVDYENIPLEHVSSVLKRMGTINELGTESWGIVR